MIWGDSLHGWRAAAPRGSDTTPRTAISSVKSVSEWKCALKSFTIPWLSGCISDFFNNLKMRGFVKMELMELLASFELQWLVKVWKGECWEGLKYEYFIVYVWQAIGYHLTREKANHFVFSLCLVLPWAVFPLCVKFDYKYDSFLLWLKPTIINFKCSSCTGWRKSWIFCFFLFYWISF